MLRHIFFCVVGLMMVLASVVLGQNGRIIDQQVFTLDDSVAKQLRETSPDTFAAIQQVEMREITYFSDGLKVKGFLLAPKRAGRYPVIIYNRGGCKNFGALTRVVVGRWLSSLPAGAM